MELTKGKLIGIVCALAVIILPDASPAGPGAGDRNLALAERVVDLQRIRDFNQAEWDYFMRVMRDEMPQGWEADMPAKYLDLMREAQVDGPTGAWTDALAESLSATRLQEVIGFLERPDAQAWIADQLAVYPHYLDMTLAHVQALGEGMAGGIVDSPEASEPAIRLSDVVAVTASPLGDVLGVIPGGRVEVSSEIRYFETVRIPANHAAVGAVFNDLEVHLYPEGEAGARIGRVSGERGYDRPEACESARTALEQGLAGYFSHADTMDCGGIRYVTSDGDTHMTLNCLDQKAFGSSRLRLSVRHDPTGRAVDEGFRAFVTDDEGDARD